MNVVLLSLLLAAGEPSSAKTGPILALDPSVILQAAEIPKLSDAALHGDAAAAWRLFNYYEYFESNIKESTFWARLAAEYGDCRAIREMINRMKHLRELDVPELSARMQAKLQTSCIPNGR